LGFAVSVTKSRISSPTGDGAHSSCKSNSRSRRRQGSIAYRVGAYRPALLLGLIARDDIGMPADMVRADALSAAGLIFAAVAGDSLLKWKK
jgi:hypothetical protein